MPREHFQKNHAPKILVVDDDQSMRDTLEAILKGTYQVLKAESGEKALEVLERNDIPLVLLDIKLLGMSGVEVLRQIKALYPWVEVIMISILTDIAIVRECFSLGALDYFTKEFDYDLLLQRVKNLLELREKRFEVIALKDQLNSQLLKEIVIGPNPHMAKIYETLKRISGAKAPILITGETGTGKELIARHIHELSPRTNSPFIPVNFPATPGNLMESLLFGHKAGSFTGADRNHIGKFELAHGGTIFLDEIGGLSFGLQSKLLRVIQEGEFEKIGEGRARRIDVRIISATNTDLKKAMEKGMFREDLYYRISTFHVHIQPLRERKEDIPALIEHFLEKYSKEFGRDIQRVERDAMDILMGYSWPGNVRELENAMERLVMLARGKVINKVDLFLNLSNSLGNAFKKDEKEVEDITPGFRKSIEEYEKKYIKGVLKKFKGDVSEAAKFAKISRRSFYAKMKEYGIKKIEN